MKKLFLILGIILFTIQAQAAYILIPMDKETIFESVKKTNKVLVLHEDCLTGGIGGEISSLINENCFESLDAPVIRCASMDTPVPFASDLEDQFLANKNLNEKIDYLINY